MTAALSRDEISRKYFVTPSDFLGQSWLELEEGTYIHQKAFINSLRPTILSINNEN